MHLGFFTSASHKGIKIHAETLDRKFTHEEKRMIESFVGLGFNSIIDIMTAVGNVLNARSNIDAVDRFMASFNTLFSSRGGNSLNLYYYMIGNFWVIFDAAAMVFRSWENRFAERKSNVEVQEAQEETNAAVEETLAALQETNAQLTLLRENLVNLIRRQDIARRGVAGKRIPAERETELSSSSDGTDDSNEKEDEEEENLVEPFTLEEAVPASYGDSNGERADISLGTTFIENDIPD